VIVQPARALGVAVIWIGQSDRQWNRIEKLCVGKPEDPGGTGADKSDVRRSGAMDRPHGLALARSACGFWEVEQYLRRASTDGARAAYGSGFLPQLTDDPDFEYLILDSTIVRAHQHAAGAKGGLKIRPSAARAAA
jgi:hypothetical protein